MKDVLACRLCGSDTEEIGRKRGEYSQQWYDIRHCQTCHFSFVANPWTEYEKIYSAEYYSGHGADPLVDYLFELEHPQETVRQYEWAGVLQIITYLTGLDAGISMVRLWLWQWWLSTLCSQSQFLSHCWI